MKHIYAKLLIGSAFAIACSGAEIPPLPIKGVVAQGSAPDDQGGRGRAALLWSSDCTVPKLAASCFIRNGKPLG